MMAISGNRKFPQKNNKLIRAGHHNNAIASRLLLRNKKDLINLDEVFFMFIVVLSEFNLLSKIYSLPFIANTSYTSWFHP